MKPPRKSDRAAPLLLLLLFLFVVHCTRQLLHLHESSGVPPHETCYIQIGGDVQRPGIYAFSRAPSLDELIARAGVRENVEAEPGSHPVFSSGERLELKREGGKVHFSRGEMNGFFKMTLGIPLSINMESETGLTALPDIGAGLARAIIEERSKRGGFKTLDELTTVPGIGHQRFLRIRPFIRL